MEKINKYEEVVNCLYDDKEDKVYLSAGGAIILALIGLELFFKGVFQCLKSK